MLNIRMGSDTGGKAAIGRLLEAYGFTTKQALSEHLNVSKSTMANRVIHQNKPFRNARHSSPKTTHISLSSLVRKKIHSMCVSPDLRKQIKKDWLIRRMNKD